MDRMKEKLNGQRLKLRLQCVQSLSWRIIYLYIFFFSFLLFYLLFFPLFSNVGYNSGNATLESQRFSWFKKWSELSKFTLNHSKNGAGSPSMGHGSRMVSPTFATTGSTTSAILGGPATTNQKKRGLKRKWNENTTATKIRLKHGIRHSRSDDTDTCRDELPNSFATPTKLSRIFFVAVFIPCIWYAPIVTLGEE